MRRRHQRGGVAVIAAITIPTIVIIASGLITIGRIQVLRQRLQYAADAVATDGALMAKRQGMANTTQPNTSATLAPGGGSYPWLPSQAITIARLTSSRDGNLPLTGTPAMPSMVPTVDNGTDWLYSRSALTTTYAGITLSASAGVRLHELRTGLPRRRPPAFVLVLDYSNSMNKSSPQFGVAITQLRSAVNLFLNNLDQNDLSVGLVIYGSNVYNTVAPATRAESGDFSMIRQYINTQAQGDTATGPALQAATQMIVDLPENFGRNIMLISDGVPCCAGDAVASAEAAGAAARANQIQMIAAVVQHSGTTGDPNAVLQNIANSSVAPYFFSVSDTAALEALITSVNVQPECDVVPPGDPNDSVAFLRNEGSGVERALQLYGNTSQIGCPDGCGVYGYVTQSPRVIFSSKACSDVFTLPPGQAPVALVRTGPPSLFQ